MEIVIAIAGVIFMARVARAEDRSPWFWGILTFCLCAAAVFLPLHIQFLPWPFLRVLGAVAVAFVLMMVAKLRAGP